MQNADYTLLFVTLGIGGRIENLTDTLVEKQGRQKILRTRMRSLQRSSFPVSAG